MNCPSSFGSANCEDFFFYIFQYLKRVDSTSETKNSSRESRDKKKRRDKFETNLRAETLAGTITEQKTSKKISCTYVVEDYVSPDFCAETVHDQQR